MKDSLLQNYWIRIFPYTSFIIVAIFLFAFRFNYWSNNTQNGYNATSWDALGYYMYLPGAFIYGDLKKLEWIPEIDKKYNVTGGEFYQVSRIEESGNYTNKYLSGVAVMQVPYFLIGHGIASVTDYEADGFSAPYQYAILFGAIFHVLIGLIVLIKVLKRYFPPISVGFTILFIGLTSNLIQYTSIDGAMSHSFIFPLYALLLYFTMRWHEAPSWKSAILIGGIIGLASISRPTEFIMVFIPLFWNTSKKEDRTLKWRLVKQYKWHILFTIIGGLIAMAPQFIYWKHTTGHLIHNVGSKWYFLNPWFRVLVGPEKGWFLYTPVAILMMIGCFYLNKRIFQRSILVFIILNIWIIISWSDWTYGASYSTRALVQSYPVFAIPLAALLSHFLTNRLSTALAISILIGFTALNFYQLSIYNKGILENFSPLLF